MSTHTCATCAYHEDSWCKFMPPTTFGPDDDGVWQSGYAVVTPIDWCGQHSALQGGLVEPDEVLFIRALPKRSEP